MTRQLEFEWTIASMRSLLRRAAIALQGRSISLTGDAKQAVGGGTLFKVLESVFAWSLESKEGRTTVSHTRGRPISEIAPGLSLRAKRGALAVLRSEQCQSCVQGRDYRLGQSPAVDMWISWPMLAEFVELLERSPAAPRRRRKPVTVPVAQNVTVQRCECHGAAEEESRCSGCTVQGAAAALSTVQRLHRPLYDGLDGSETESNSSSIPGDSERSQGDPEREEEESPERKQVGSLLVERGVPVAFIRTSGQPWPGRPARASQGAGFEGDPSTLNALRSDLRRLGVKLVDELLADALQLNSLERVAEVVAYAISREIPTDGKPLRPWGPGAVFLRLTRHDLVDLPADDGWAKSDPAWKAEWDKQASRRAREREAMTSRKAAAARSKSIEALEAEFGSLVDQVEPRRLFDSLEIGWRSEVRSREDLRKPMIRRELLILAAVGKFNTSEGE